MSYTFILSIVLLIQYLNASCTNKPLTTTPSPDIKYRLPKSLKPLSYDINLSILFDTSIAPSSYDGSIEIKFNCEQNTNHIVLNKAYLDVNESSILLKQTIDDTQINVISSSYDNQTQLYDLFVSNGLESGKNYSLSMKYKGYVQNNGYGLYKSYYKDANGNSKWLVASYMAPTAARMAFPCFDEPEMKAIFKLTVIHNQNLEAMSNMPREVSLMLVFFFQKLYK
jgi:aminopeptidase N